MRIFKSQIMRILKIRESWKYNSFKKRLNDTNIISQTHKWLFFHQLLRIDENNQISDYETTYLETVIPTIPHNSFLEICYWSLRTKQIQLKLLKINKCIRVRDIDQTDLHRFEPSSRTLLWDEHSQSRLIIIHLEKISRHRGAKLLY